MSFNQQGFYQAEFGSTPQQQTASFEAGGFHAPPQQFQPPVGVGVDHGGGQPQQPYYFQPTFDPSGSMDMSGTAAENDDDDSVPLLEELGINFTHIYQKTFAVLNPLSNPEGDLLHDNDLAGPLVFCIAFAASLLLSGKLHFGFIYGVGVMGCLSMYGLLRLMSDESIALISVMSIMGYCLLPMTLISLASLLIALTSIIGYLVVLGSILWCSHSASKLIVRSLRMHEQQALIAYPCALIYGVFALLAMF